MHYLAASIADVPVRLACLCGSLAPLARHVAVSIAEVAAPVLPATPDLTSDLGRRTSDAGWRTSNAGRRAWVVAVATLAATCGAKGPTAPSSADALSQRIVTAHFVFRLAADDTVDAAWQEAYHAWAVAQLGVNPPPIEYNKYRSRAHMGAITGNASTNGYAEPSAMRLHTIWPTDNHEVVHVYAGAWGSPVALFGEGFAVAHQMNPVTGDFVARWSGTPVHELARRFRSSGQLPPIADVAETNAFRSHPDGVTYPIAGSFVRFLIDAEGMAAMRRLFGSMGPTAPLSTVRGAFQQVYGFSLEEGERRWLAAIAEQ